MKSVLIILIVLLSFSGCNYSNNPETDFIDILDNQEECFLDFRLGMRDYKYERAVKKYIDKGILRETLIPREYNADMRVLSYYFQSIGLKGELWPLIPYDRLQRLAIDFEEEIGDEKNPTITLNEYRKVVNLFQNEYGKPTEIRKVPDPRYISTIWELEDYIVSISMHPAIDTSKNRISVSFGPNSDLEKAFFNYNEEKKVEQGKIQ